MTVTLSHVVLIDQKGQYHLFDDLVVASRKIRQIQLPNLVIILTRLICLPTENCHIIRLDIVKLKYIWRA